MTILRTFGQKSKLTNLKQIINDEKVLYYYCCSADGN